MSSKIYDRIIYDIERSVHTLAPKNKYGAKRTQTHLLKRHWRCKCIYLDYYYDYIDCYYNLRKMHDITFINSENLVKSSLYSINSAQIDIKLGKLCVTNFPNC